YVQLTLRSFTTLDKSVSIVIKNKLKRRILNVMRSKNKFF
ncbi:3115_t:CDS:1, partial [Gigaspora margarita]